MSPDSSSRTGNEPATGDEPAVRLEGVSRRFGRTWALRSVDLTVEPGELLAVVGPNGAGKTTLLELLATLREPTEGRVRVLGWDPAGDARAVRRRVGLLPADDYLYDDLTARENLRFAAFMSGQRDWEEPAGAALERTGLVPFAERRVDGFSSGMRRRLGIARLLLRPLELVLLDEPYASLDADGIDMVDELVEELRGGGRTVLVASHRWGRSLREADRVAELEGGRLVGLGPPGEHAPPDPAPAGRGA